MEASIGNSSPSARSPKIAPSAPPHRALGHVRPAEVLHVPAVGGAEAFGDEAVERLPEGLGRRVAEHPFGGGVEEDDALLVVHGDDGVQRRIHDAGQARLAVAKGLLVHLRLKL